MNLQFYRLEEGYLVCPASGSVPASYASELRGRRPDMNFLSRDTVGRKFIEDHMRLNGFILMDEAVANIMLANYPAWVTRTF